MIDNLGLLSPIEHLLQQGGALLAAIFAVTFIILVLFFERAYYLMLSFPKQIGLFSLQWASVSTQNTWQAQRMREAMLAQGEVLLSRSQWLLKICIMVCPLLGLTGTVSGMILVFDNLSFAGTGNPRLMSSGIFQATIPTMAGMLVAIIGMLLQQIITRMTKRKKHALEQALKLNVQAQGPTP